MFVINRKWGKGKDADLRGLFSTAAFKGYNARTKGSHQGDPDPSSRYL